MASGGRPPFMRALDQVRRQLEQQMRNQQAGGGGPMRSGGGGGGPNMGAIAGGGGLLFLLAGGGILLSQSLFNVDGGHRAIKYSRMSGIKQEIYPEGTHLMVRGTAMARGDYMRRLTSSFCLARSHRFRGWSDPSTTTYALSRGASAA